MKPYIFADNIIWIGYVPCQNERVGVFSTSVLCVCVAFIGAFGQHRDNTVPVFSPRVFVRNSANTLCFVPDNPANFCIF